MMIVKQKHQIEQQAERRSLIFKQTKVNSVVDFMK